MKQIGIFEAKTHLSELLDKVAAGQEFVITRRGRPIARLVPATTAQAAEIQRTVEEIARFSAGRRLGQGGWKALRDSGRRW